MDLQGQNLYGFSELVYFPDRGFEVQQFLSDQGANIEIGDEVEIHQPLDFNQTEFQLEPNIGRNNVTETEGQSGNVEIETVTTGYNDMPSFDDLLDFNDFEFVGNHVSVASEGLELQQSVDVLHSENQLQLVGVGWAHDGKSNFESISNIDRGKKGNSSDENEETTDCDEDSECERKANEERENKVVSQLSVSDSSLPKTNSRSKRKGWIKYRFVTGLRSFVSKLEIIKMRTGAIGKFKAIFEEEEYNQDNVSRLLPEKKKKDSIPSPVARDERDSSSNSMPKSISANPEPDHSYSATILTQKESSPTVHDHQYNEASISGKKEKSRGKKQHLFVNGRYQREKALLMFLKTIFTKKKDMEASTGAWIELTVDYEDYTFTQNNLKDASNMLRKKRRIHQVFTSISQSSVALEESQISNPFQPKHKIIIKAPKSSYRLNQTSKIVGSRGKTVKLSIVEVPSTKITPCIQFLDSDPMHLDENVYRHGHEGKTCDDTRLDNTSMSASFHSEGAHYNSIDVGAQCSNPSKVPEQTEKLPSKRSILYETENEDFPSSPTESGNVGCGDDSFSPLLSPAATESMFVNVPTQSTGVNSIRKDTEDCGTNTEPICGICFANQPNTYNHSQQHSQEIFWIRCFNPLCHYIVHASCIGFYVTSPLHLKMFPPYFCENHRN